jgi:ferrous iron transport protein B
MRLPMPVNVLRKTWVRTLVFLKEAAPLFVWGSLLVSIAQVTGLLTMAEQALAPLTVKLLYLPPETAQAFLMGMVRRDFGAAGLYFLAPRLAEAQILTALITIAFFVPCMASFTVMWKERGIGESLLVLAGSWLMAFGVGAIAARTVPLLL